MADVVKVGDRIGSHLGKTGKVVSVSGSRALIQWDNGGRVEIYPDLDADGNGNFYRMDAVSMDAIEVSMPDGTEVCVDPKGDEARAGMMSALLYATSARCPYCTKSVSMSRATLGFHRGPGGVCLGSEKAVARIDMGNAVLFGSGDDWIRRNQQLIDEVARKKYGFTPSSDTERRLVLYRDDSLRRRAESEGAIRPSAIGQPER